MEKKKKILMVHNYYQTGGGEHTVFESEVDMLKKNGHDVVTYIRSNDELKKNKLKLLFLPIVTCWSMKTYVEIRKLIKEEKIEVVHCHNTFPLISPSVYYAARSLKVPVVQTIHNFRLLCPAGVFNCNGNTCEECRIRENFLCALKNKCYRKSILQTAVVVTMLKLHRFMGTYRKISYIFLTEFNKEKFKGLIDISSSQVFIKPNSVERIKNEKCAKGKKRQFIFAGRLEESKGISFVLDAWKNVPSNFRLHIYGDGPLKDIVEETVKYTDNVKYFGFQPREIIYRDLETAQALLFASSLYEGFPMTIAESFSIGKPVVSTDIGNQRDIIVASEGGVLFSLHNEESFYKALYEVMDNNEKYSEKAKTYYENYLCEDYNYRKLREIYDKVKHID